MARNSQLREVPFAISKMLEEMDTGDSDDRKVFVISGPFTEVL